MRYLILVAALLFPSIAVASPGDKHQMKISISVDGATRERLDALGEKLHFEVVYFADDDEGGMDHSVASGEMDCDSSRTVTFTEPRGHFDNAWVSGRTAWKSRRINLVRCTLPTFDPSNPPSSIEVECSLM